MRDSRGDSMWKLFVKVCFLLPAVKELNGVEARSSAFLGRLLVIPLDGSHWMDIKAIAQEMGRRGHEVTVVIPEVSLRLGPGEHYTTLTYPVSYSKEELESVIAGIGGTLNKPLMDKINQALRMITFFPTIGECLLRNTSLISHLAQQSFDAILTNPILPIGPLVARKLGVPIINIQRFIPCGIDMRSAACPSPPSYVPRFGTQYTDKMNFKERVFNTLGSLLEPLFCQLILWPFERLASDFLGGGVGIADVLKDTAIWLMRTDFTLDHPRPLMPNMVMVGGMTCERRHPLPEELQPWVSGEDGFVVFTLGSLVSSLPEDITAVFLQAFTLIPQKAGGWHPSAGSVGWEEVGRRLYDVLPLRAPPWQVLWRYTGPVPDSIPENVKLMKWLPQNDLLAHDGVRAFITHAGSHGLYEGVCHGVPMVMLPIIGDQPDNAHRLASRGVGVVLDIQTVTVETLLQGLSEVINNTRYKESISKLSVLHKDRPISPSELSAFWIEFVMRHKGAAHLTPAAHQLSWLQYHSVDVVTVILLAVALVLMGTVTCMRLCLRRTLFRKRKHD